ncbi:superoxide dismutase [Cu-Zn]-like isoform X2 [Oculina patagonica]
MIASRCVKKTLFTRHFTAKMDTTMLLFACGLMVLGTSAAPSATICQNAHGIVTAVSFITRNAAPPPGAEKAVVGKVKMTQSACGGPTSMCVYIWGLSPCTTHGFHIHEGNDTTTDGCQSTGGHYNPFNKTHGGPQDQIRHVGDLGNLKADYMGVINTQLIDHLISLVGPNSVIGRSFVIHQKPDDLGRGTGAAKNESLITGNAGARLGCGVIFHDPIN